MEIGCNFRATLTAREGNILLGAQHFRIPMQLETQLAAYKGRQSYLIRSKALWILFGFSRGSERAHLRPNGQWANAYCASTHPAKSIVSSLETSAFSTYPPRNAARKP
jgi:hypothetical protein